MPHYAVEEALADGVYSVTTTTHYNAAGQPLISVQKRLISQLSGTLESKSVFVNERGLTSTQWTVYSGGTKRVQYSTVPGASIPAETVTVSGVVRSQKDTAGITTTATRSYTANGIKKHPVFKFLINGISTTSGTILGVKIDVEAKFCICRNGEHEFVNCHGTAETFPIRIAIASPTRHSVKQLNRLPEYFAQASYSAVEELYKVKTHHEKK